MSHLCVQTKLETVSSNVQKQVELLSFLSMNKCIIFLGVGGLISLWLCKEKNKLWD
jgi:hypothetical protein